MYIPYLQIHVLNRKTLKNKLKVVSYLLDT